MAGLSALATQERIARMQDETEREKIKSHLAGQASQENIETAKLRDVARGREQALGQRFLEQNAASLGDPGRSYGGGKLNLREIGQAKAAGVTPTGLPTEQTVSSPVHVIRGVKSTYAGGAAGEEWQNPAQAVQAIHRAYGAGEYAPLRDAAGLEAAKQENREQDRFRLLLRDYSESKNKLGSGLASELKGLKAYDPDLPGKVQASHERYETGLRKLDELYEPLLNSYGGMSLRAGAGAGKETSEGMAPTPFGGRGKPGTGITPPRGIATEKTGEAQPAPTPGAASTERKAVRTGMLNGKKVIQYSDGTTEYAD